MAVSYVSKAPIAGAALSRAESSEGMFWAPLWRSCQPRPQRVHSVTSLNGPLRLTRRVTQRLGPPLHLITCERGLGLMCRGRWPISQLLHSGLEQLEPRLHLNVL